MSVACPTCGATISVPRLRDLAAFEVPQVGRQERPWRASHAWLLVGCFVTVTASFAAVMFSQFDGGASERLPDERLIRLTVESADAATIHKAWQALKSSGVDRGAIPDELLVQKAARAIGRVAVLLWTVAACGAFVTIVGGITAALSPTKPGGIGR